MTDMNRRNFLGLSMGGFAGFTLQHRFNLAHAFSGARKAKAVIVLWMDGGPSQCDTFDLKPKSKYGTPFKEIETAAEGVRISEHLPLLAKEMKDVSLIRSMWSKEEDHFRGAYLLHTGYRPSPVMQHPTLGSILSYESKENGIPRFVSVKSGYSLLQFNNTLGPGFLGPRYAQFSIDQPKEPHKSVQQMGGDLEERIGLVEAANRRFGQQRTSNNQDKRRTFLEMAKGLPDGVFAKALDLGKEDAKVVKEYLGDNEGRQAQQQNRYFVGDTESFGYGCLLARRLVQAGVSCVEVNLGGWDTHAQNRDRTRDLMQILDPAYSALIRDLRRNDMLDETLVVWMGEFGRTPVPRGFRNNQQRDGRDHWPKSFSVALAGGGVQGGRVVGETDDKGVEIKKRPVSVADLFASIYHSFGVSENKKYGGRDVAVFSATDGGKPVKELFD